MHEIGIMQSVLARVDREARKAGAREIHAVRLRVGQLSGVVPDSLQYAFEVMRNGTLASGARLIIEDVPAACWCSACSREFESPEILSQCPQCGALSADLRRGRELELASLEIS